jgi:hypothetical protein
MTSRISVLSVRATSQAETEPETNSRKVHREFSKLMRKMEGPTDGGVMEDGRDIRHVSLVESGG